MKIIKILAVLFLGCSIALSSCSDDDNLEITTMNVNHFKQSGESLYPSQFLLVQEGGAVNGFDWNLFYGEIEGFNYELGYLYSLKIKKETLENPPADGSSIRYKLIEEVSKVRAPSDEPFEILLSRPNGNNIQAFVGKNSDSTFQLLDGTKIECGNLCGELAEKLTNKEPITGVFYHLKNDEIELIGLK
ncbi:DUF4377 domain-containing protein [Aureibaculum sp. 2210JD6-5]|uniref:DUF4377 domain-containing protein n=1 Tax=Aureibaculum sp. 2210JD6-5 TaxID=3103957 RepID=UPI002AAE0F71|nr:DUF4377 domain-containing protein [Aureibaculum sp. 2210JD6-5]MDY7394838.1 DUF4377 domain-containing protein [Aureibaculum sp. 2210JD6-5]